MPETPINSVHHRQCPHGCTGTPVVLDVYRLCARWRCCGREVPLKPLPPKTTTQRRYDR